MSKTNSNSAVVFILQFEMFIVNWFDVGFCLSRIIHSINVPPVWLIRTLSWLALSVAEALRSWDNCSWVRVNVISLHSKLISLVGTVKLPTSEK